MRAKFGAAWGVEQSETTGLTTDAGDTVTGTGEYKVCAAKIEPVAESVAEQVFPGAYAAVEG